MKKNLFVLFSLYFFVVQPIFVWLLRQEPNMLILAIINLVVILIILLISKAMESKSEKPRKESHKAAAHKETIHEDKETLFQPHHHEPIKKGSKKGWVWKGLLGLILGIVLYILLMGSSFGYKLIIASLIALILLFFICLFTKSIKRFFTLAGTKILLCFLALGIIIFWYQFSFLTTNTSLKGYVIQNVTASRLFFSTIVDSSDTYVLTGEGSVIGSGMTSGETSSDIIDLFSGMQGNSDVVVDETPVVTWTTTTTVTPTWTSLHMGEMLKALIAKYNIPLVTKKDVKFTYVSYSNELYPYFRTAYASALIGSSTNPTKLALCDTLIVMKWLLEKWPVTYTSATVMQKFRDYAVANDKLNGCEKGKVVKDNNL